MMSDQSSNESELRRKNIYRMLFGVMFIQFSILVLYPISFRGIRAFLIDGKYQGQILALFALASIFPLSALAYQLFQSETQQRRLGYDLWLLGIHIPRKKHSNSKNDDAHANNSYHTPEQYVPNLESYETHANDLYKRSYNFWNFIVQSTLVVLLTILGLSLFFWPPFGEDKLVQNANTLQAMRYGFLGAYIYSLQLVYRRYTTFDLQPSVYINCAITMIAGVTFNFVVFEAISEISSNPSMQEVTGLAGGLLAVVAFSLGYFPSLVIRWFNRIAYSALGMPERQANSLPLSLIDGISQLHETRLRDEGIDNIQNLASCGLSELLTNTRFSAQQVIEWVDQAVLYMYLEQAEINRFRYAGVRSFSDFKDQWKKYHDLSESSASEEQNKPSQEAKEAKEQYAKQFQSTPDRLDALYLATLAGPNIPYIENYWIRANMQQIEYQRQMEYTIRMATALVALGETEKMVSLRKDEVLANQTKVEREKGSLTKDVLSTFQLMLESGAVTETARTAREYLELQGKKQELEHAKTWAQETMERALNSHTPSTIDIGDNNKSSDSDQAMAQDKSVSSQNSEQSNDQR